MTTEKIQFKEYPRPGNLGLEHEGRSKFPNCNDFLQPAKSGGRWVTGLDEDALKINRMSNSKEKEALKESIKSKREALERLTNLDLSGTSDYWNTYLVAIDTSRALDMSNPTDNIAYHVIIANGEAAPSVRDAREGSQEHRTAKYYVARENEDVSDKVLKKKKYNKAITEFMDLIEDSDKTLLIASYLGLNITEATPSNNRFDIVQNFLDNDEALGSVDKFLMALEKTPEELSLKMIFDKALKLKVIRLKDGLYQRGNITFGRTPKEVLDKLQDPALSGEVLSIQEEIENKRKFG